MSNYKPFNGHTEGTLEVLEEDGTYSLLIDDGEPGAMYIAREIQQGESNGEDDAEFIAEAWNSYYPSREIIEKLVDQLELANGELYSARINGSLVDRVIEMERLQAIAEARAFLNKKP